MKLLSVAALSAVLVVPCFANAKVSAGSPNLPYPRDLGRGIVAGSPNLPYPRNGIVMNSPNLPFPRDLGRSVAMGSPTGRPRCRHAAITAMVTTIASTT